MGWTVEVYCKLQSRSTFMKGIIFVTGRRHSDGATLTNVVLWGILNFIFDAMELYGGIGGDEEEEEEQPISTLKRWGDEYKHQGWIRTSEQYHNPMDFFKPLITQCRAKSDDTFGDGGRTDRILHPASQSIRNQECRPGRVLSVCLKARRSHSTCRKTSCFRTERVT